MLDFNKKEIYVVALLIFAILTGSGVLIYRDQQTGNITVVTELGEEVSFDSNGDSQEQALEEEARYIYVDVSGEVKKPGVYKLDEGSRVFEAIEEAGGITEEAFTDNINMASLIFDEQKVHIPSKNQDVTNGNHEGLYDEGVYRVRINTASQSQLEGIPGIGPVIAGRIIEYRVENGPFATPEDIMNVPGIGEATFEQINDYITIL